MRIAINGFGRIGRCVLRAAYERQLLASTHEGPVDIVAVNELADARTIAYLTQYDSTHGRFPAGVTATGSQLQIEESGASIRLLAERSVRCLPWQELGAEWILDCSGEVQTETDARLHIDAGAKSVLLSNPGESGMPTIVYGFNHADVLSGAEQPPRVISAASCTSNALIPALAALHKKFGVKSGVITTIHAAMHDQPVIDAYHGGDLRKNRASSESFIPVSTELAAGVDRLMPELKGCIVAQAIRVPVSNVSALNVTLNLDTAAGSEAVNSCLEEAGESYPRDVLAVSSEPLASCDFIHHPVSGTVDAMQTQVVDGRTVNLLIWFDNEWAFANRMLDVLLAANSLAK